MKIKITTSTKSPVSFAEMEVGKIYTPVNGMNHNKVFLFVVPSALDENNGIRFTIMVNDSGNCYLEDRHVWDDE